MKSSSSNENHKKSQKKDPWKKYEYIIIGLLILVILCVFLLIGLLFTHPVSLDVPQRTENIKPTSASESEPPEYDLNQGDRISDYFTFLICVKDKVASLTDTMIVAGFNTENHTINFMNIPRDTMSNVERYGSDKKINAAYAIGGIEQAKTEVSFLTGFVPDRYLIIDLQSIEKMVDLVGGVDYNIPFRMKYDAPDQNLHIDFQPGMQHLDGKEVVEFLRWRQNNPGIPVDDDSYDGSDTARIKKLQDFLIATSKQVLTIKNIPHISSIAAELSRMTDTDFSARELLWLCGQMFQLDNIEMMTLPGYPSYTYAGTSNKYWFFIPDETALVELLNQYFNPFTVPISRNDLDIVY